MARRARDLRPIVRPGEFWEVALVQWDNVVPVMVTGITHLGEVDVRVQLTISPITPTGTQHRVSPRQRGWFRSRIIFSGLPPAPAQPAYMVSAPVPVQVPVQARPARGPRRAPPPLPRPRLPAMSEVEAAKKAMRTGHRSHWAQAWSIRTRDPAATATGLEFLRWKLAVLEAHGKGSSSSARATRKRMASATTAPAPAVRGPPRPAGRATVSTTIRGGPTRGQRQRRRCASRR